MNVLCDGEFFAQWTGSLQALADFSGYDVARFSYEVDEVKLPRALPESEEQVTEQLRATVQDYMDSVARHRSYDSMLSLCSYATSSNDQFRAEAQAGLDWRDVCWAFGHDILAQVLAGTMPIPTQDELVAMLPKMKWPEEAEPTCSVKC
ncbi:hypothetical protein QYE80_13255 [Pseudomonas tohonis]|uniref:hypothetical protein n=1 Tax=Pseudomonas sp. zfem005 TaxID=3078200 RepID=UPI00039730EB|nr:hypothetical protein [Pseudomonas sp. zfem005]EQM72066.1 hypothetical protein L682_00170 [Pseudomonas alcaligenes OT 69]MDN4145957.1 hypothetical protein [Pseudomonas tohonis]MDU9415290.1 hypothetical protein [Pseudomonas sp. zfem005]